MKLHWTNSKYRWKDSLTLSLTIITTLQTIKEICGFADDTDISWWAKLLVLIGFFVVVTLIIFVAKQLIIKKGLSLQIGNNNVIIKKSDLFKEGGWQLIPFNEYFDTKVDDVVIAHNSLNGIFIDNYVENIKDLQQVISSENTSLANGKYPLGHIIRYKNKYLLLAFTHFKDNVACLSHTDYERSLICMWQEIEKLYANKTVNIPLLGSGITRFTDTPSKDLCSLLKCLLCSLRISGVHIKTQITICLTPEAMEDINLYELKTF